jgi:hypothetical protein
MPAQGAPVPSVDDVRASTRAAYLELVRDEERRASADPLAACTTASGKHRAGIASHATFVRWATSWGIQPLDKNQWPFWQIVRAKRLEDMLRFGCCDERKIVPLPSTSTQPGKAPAWAVDLAAAVAAISARLEQIERRIP